MIKMKYLLISVIITISFHVRGQNHFIGIKGGVNYTNINSDTFFSTSSYRTGINGGFLYDFKLNKKIHFGIEALYSQKGFKYDIHFTDQFGDVIEDKLTLDYNYNYLSLPLKAGIEFGDKFSGFTNISFVPSILVRAKTHIPAWRNVIVSDTFDVTEDVTLIDLSGLIEIGFGYRITDDYIIFTSVSCQVGINSFANSEYFANSRMTHFGLNSAIGLKYKLK